MSDQINVKELISRLLAVRGKRYPDTIVEMSEFELTALCLRSSKILLCQPMLLRLSGPIFICGDIHGQFVDLLRIFDLCGMPPESSYLFLGDFVDRGNQQIETITLLLALKCEFPECFHILRGNHECSKQNKKDGFFDQCTQRYTETVWHRFNDTFNNLPVAALVNDVIFACHGGISPELNSLKQIEDIPRPICIPRAGLLCDLVWADPDKNLTDWEDNEQRGCSFLYGRNALDKFLKKENLQMICRAHEMKANGYELLFNNQLVTIFSAPNYEKQNNYGAIFCVKDDLTCHFETIPPENISETSG